MRAIYKGDPPSMLAMIEDGQNNHLFYGRGRVLNEKYFLQEGEAEISFLHPNGKLSTISKNKQ